MLHSSLTRSDEMFTKMRRYASALAAVGLLCGACQHASDPPAKPTTASLQPAGGAAGSSVTAGAGTHEIGALAPVMTLRTIDGDVIDLAKLYGGKPVYLKFWATWCVPCREQLPGFKRIYDALGDRMNVIAVNIGLNDDAADVRAFREQWGLRMPIVIDDGRLAAALDLQVTVQHVVIGRDARLVYVDHRDGAPLDEALRKVLAEPGPSGQAAGRALVTGPPAFRPGDLVGLETTTIDGARVALGRGRDGRPRGVVFFSTWFESYLATSRPEVSAACRRVREEVERLVAAGDVDWLGIAGGPWQSVEDLTEYRSTTNTKLPLALDADGALFRAFGVHDLPAIALLDPAGHLVRLLGPNDRDLTDAVRALHARN